MVVYSIEACSRAQGIGDTGKRGCTVQFHICVDEKKNYLGLEIKKIFQKVH